MAIILGFSGKRGSGKSTISRQVAKALGWGRAGFGDYVRGEARRLGLGVEVETLQTVGEALIAKGPETFCRAVLWEAGWGPDISLIVDGIRHAEVVSALREVVAPAQFRLVYISLEEPLRESRLLKRDNISSGEARQYDRHSTEAQVETTLRGLSDLVLDGAESESALVGKIVLWVRRIYRHP